MTLSRSPKYMAFSRAVMDEKSLSPLFPVDGGAVVTNDWCIKAEWKNRNLILLWPLGTTPETGT